MVVPKKSQPGELPRISLCVDYRALNSTFKATGVLTHALLPKINQIYARLNGSCINFTFDMQSEYLHIELSKESQPKSAFSYKWESLSLLTFFWIGTSSCLFSKAC